jgi:hypothetical protein
MLRASPWTVLALLVVPWGAVRAAAPPPTVHASISHALPLLRAGAKGHVANRTCFACHNQAMAVLALTTARRRGYRVDEKEVREQLDHIASFLDRNRDKYRQGTGQGGQADTAGYALATLEWGGWKADATTEAVVEYLLRYKNDRDHWTATSNRPPSEASSFTTSYVSLRALRTWGTPGQKERVGKRIDQVRAWLQKAKPKDTEDRVFRLRALHEVGVTGPALAPAVEDLVRTQRGDGGWGQLDRLDSDAYATGSALVALHQAGGLPTGDRAYQRGLAFLVRTQQPDGSWLVRSRSRPFQTYYESGFPHGKNQFISMAATGWAVTALALACPEPLDRSRNR